MSMRSGSGVLAAFALACAGAGCGATVTQLKQRAIHDLDCPIERIETSKIDPRTQAAKGCGREAIYVESCDSPAGTMYRSCTWVLNSTSAQSVADTKAAAAPVDEAPVEDAKLEELQTREGEKELRLFLRGDNWKLIVRAVPKRDAGHARLLLRSLSGTSTCEVKFMANGERLRVDGVKHHVLDDSRNEYRFELPYDDLMAMAAAQRVLGRYCDSELSLGQVHFEKLRELVIRIREELAWDEEPPAEAPQPTGSTEL